MTGRKRIPLWKRLRCAFRGHKWANLGTLVGRSLVVCNRCEELVVAEFVDVPAGEVLLKGFEAGITGPMGDLETGRAAVTYVSSIVNEDRRRNLDARSRLTARPGEGVDSLAIYAGILLSTLQDEHGPRWVETFEAYQSNRHDLVALFESMAHDEGAPK